MNKSKPSNQSHTGKAASLDAPVPSEIVRFSIPAFNVPEVRGRVEVSPMPGVVMVSVGSCRFGAPSELFLIHDRGVEPPTSWLQEEVLVARGSFNARDTLERLLHYKRKERAIRAEQAPLCTRSSAKPTLVS